MQRTSRKILFFVPAIFLLALLAFTETDSSISPANQPVNGEYVIYVLKNDSWLQAGSLSYDRLFVERELSLDRYINEGDKVQIKIREAGGGAAHIDSVFIGGAPPVYVKDIDNGLRKLGRKDFDVIDASGKTIEMSFDAKGADRTLKLTARIEAINISKIPFQFPVNNTGRLIDADSQFYPYTLDSERGRLKMDGKLSEVSNKSPFFKEYSWTGTGHPSGFTYGWVWNDDRNLYVAIDFTPDNTMDGDKDYAKVIINNGAEIKEFKVSVAEMKWGNAGFSYTDKVNYQHKVYEFKIPLSRIQTGNEGNADELLLAFASYGTAAPNQIQIFLQAEPYTSEVFAYTSDILLPTNFNLVNSGPMLNQIFFNVPPGTYTFAQASTPSGWTLSNIDCLNSQGVDSSNVNLQAGSVSIPFSDGDAYACVFTNSQSLFSIPALTQWGIALFAVLAGLGALYYLRRGRTAHR